VSRRFNDWEDPFSEDTDPDEEDLWFLPGPDEEDDEDAPPGFAPLPRASRQSLFDPVEWRVAQNALSAELSRLCQVFGELDLRLREAGQGQRQRIALREATDLSWWTGDRLGAEKLGLWVALRVGSTEDTEQALARSGWAVRRLTSGPFPGDGLAAFLERGEENDPLDLSTTTDLSEVMASVETLHPVVQSLVAFSAWRILGVEQSRDTEAAVLAARHAATMSRLPGQGALFLPLATTGPNAFRGQGTVVDKLAAWIRGAEQACLAALLQLERLTAWRRAASEAVADLSGRTPELLLDALEAWPLLSAPLAEKETGVSRAAVQRNFDRLMDRGLVREVTGQGRYRVWSAGG